MKNRKIRILRVYSGIVILIAVVVILAAVRLGRMGDGLRSMQDITEEYIDAQQAVHSMREASNFLTEQSREFVISGETAHLKAYLDEINDTQRRDLALKVLEEETDIIRRKIEFWEWCDENDMPYHRPD